MEGSSIQWPIAGKGGGKNPSLANHAPTVVVQSVESDSVEPGRQSGFTSEGVESPLKFQENFLNAVLRLFAAQPQPQSQSVDLAPEIAEKDGDGVFGGRRFLARWIGDGLHSS